MIFNEENNATVIEIKSFFKKQLKKEYRLINEKEVLQNLEKSSDEILITHGGDFKRNPKHAYSCLSSYLKVRTDSCF